MILSKASLQVVALSKKDQAVPGLDKVFIEDDGTVVAASRNTVIAVQGVDSASVKNLPIKDSGPVQAVVSCELVKKVISSIEKDTVFKGKLEYTDLAEDSKYPDDIVFSIDEGRRRPVQINGTKDGEDWIPWRTIFKNSGDAEVKPQRVVLNRARLAVLLDVLNKIAPESSGETPVYLEFTTDNRIILRAKNFTTGQRVLGIMTNYDGKWLDESEWENNLLYPPKRRKYKKP